MAGFQLIWLDKEDIECANSIMKQAGVSSIDEAVKWALKQAATTAKAAKPHLRTRMELSGSAAGAASPEPDPIPIPKPIKMPLGSHSCEIVPMNKLAQFEHTVLIGSATLERLVPDKETRLSLFGDSPI